MVLGASGLAPVALCVVFPRSRRRDAAVCALNMWAYIAAYEMPHDDPERLAARVKMDYPIAVDRVLGLGVPPTLRLQRAFAKPGQISRFERVLVWCHWLWFLTPHTSLAYVALFNLLALSGGGIDPSAVRGLGLEQSWGMFAPRPNPEDGWFVVVGKQNNGKEVDLLRGGPVSWGEPESFAALYPNVRWAAYAVALTRPVDEPYRPYFAAYLGRRWNAGHTGGEAVKSIEVYYMLRYIRQPDHTATPPEKVRLVRLPPE